MNRSLHRGLLVVCCCLVGAGLAVGPAAATDQPVPVAQASAVAGGHGGGSAVAGPAPGSALAATVRADGNETTDNSTDGNTTANESDGPPPTVALSLDGDAIAADSYTVVASDPTLTVDASVGDPGNGTELKTVEVRIDGQVVRSYSVDGASASVSLTLPLSTGNNSVRVLVEDTADRLTQVDVVVAKDDVAPWIGLTSPQETDPYAVVPNLTVRESLVTFGVEIVEFSGVEHASVEVVGDHGRDAVFLEDPGTAFERDLLVGFENNTVTIRAEDTLGNTRIRRFEVRLNDSEPPAVALDTYPAQTTENTVDLTGTFVDNVWVSNASVTVDYLDASNTTGPTNYTEDFDRNVPYQYSADGRRVPFERELLLKHGRNRIEIRVRDHLGQTANRTITVERVRERRTDRNAPPRVVLDTNRTRLLPGGRVRIVAHVSDETLNLRSVAAETRTLEGDEIVDFERFTDLDGPGQVVLNTTLRAADGTTVVRVRATDDEGARDAAVQQVTDGATTPRPTEAPTTTAATATAAPPDGTTVTRRERARQSTTTAGNATSGGLPLVGSVGGVVGGVAGVLAGIAPFTVGSFVFVVVTYVVVRQITERQKQAS